MLFKTGTMCVLLFLL